MGAAKTSQPQHFTPADSEFMAAAFAQARKVKGKTLPNPPVGAVVVKAGRIIAQGGTRAAGQAHAEIVALKKAGVSARGATLYVTLEPCNHFGKTPPCTQAIVKAGIARVVISVMDANPLIGGGGVRELRRCGVQVEVGLLREAGQDFYEAFFFFIQRGRPLIHLKIAQSLDGRVNASPGQRTPITGMEAQKWSHALRSQVDAILVGAGTVRADDPDLTPRLVKGSHPECLVLSRSGEIPPHAKLMAPGRKARTVLLTSAARPVPEWVELEPFPISAKAVRAAAAGLLQIFRKRNYHSVLVEGGSQVWRLLLTAGLWDRLHILTAPKLLPGGEKWDTGLPADWGKGLIFHKFANLGADILWTAENPASP